MESKQPYASRTSGAMTPTRVEEIQRYLDELSDADELPDTMSMRMEIRLGWGMDLRLSACSEADWDAAALEFEYVFTRRFGVDWPRADRALLLACKQSYLLTDGEIRTLLRARAIRRRGKQVSLKVDRWLPFSGYCQIAILANVLVPLALSVLWQRMLPYSQVLIAAGCGLVLGALMRVIYCTHVEPWRIFRRATQ